MYDLNKAIVTGGCGFIGSHLVDDLIKEGVEVEVIDDLSATENELFYHNPSASYHQFNILNSEMVNSTFETFKPDAVFHLAAKARIQRAIQNPTETCEVNFSGTANILEASRLYEVDRVMFSCTSSVYGLKNSCPLKEDMPKDCLNPYSISKSAAEELCKMYYDLYGLKTVTFRYFNVFGERQPLRGDYAPVVGLFYRQKALGKRMTIVGDGEQTRDFTYVKDVVQANMLAAKTNNVKAFGEVFNVGSGKSYSVIDIATIIQGLTSFLPEREGEARHTLADISKIQEVLDFLPSISLEEWMKNENNKIESYAQEETK
jgi:UDP-glucose 4-epimerase